MKIGEDRWKLAKIGKNRWKQAGAELCQAKVELEVIVYIGVKVEVGIVVELGIPLLVRVVGGWMD